MSAEIDRSKLFDAVRFRPVSRDEYDDIAARVADRAFRPVIA